MLISSLKKKRLICEAQKIEGRFDPKKNFFDFFMLRRLESVFKAETNFFEKFFFEFFVKFDGEHQSGAAPSCDHYTPKNSA